MTPLTNDRPVSSLARLVQTVDRGLTAIDRVLLFFVCTTMLSIMLLVSADAVMRYGFNSPLVFANELVTLYLLPAAMFLGVSYTLRRGGHVGVDLFVQMMPMRIQQFVIGLVLLASLPIMAIMSWEVSVLTWESLATKETSAGLVAWIIWPSKFVVAISLVVLLVRLVVSALTHLLAALHDDETLAVPIMPPRETAAEDAV